MKNFIILSFLAFSCVEAKCSRRQLKDITDKLDELEKLVSDGQQKLDDKQLQLSEKVQQISDGQQQFTQKVQQISDGQQKLIDGQENLQQKIESIEDRLGESCKGKWHLGMNINPADGHIFGYTVGRIIYMLYSIKHEVPNLCSDSHNGV